MVVVSVQLVTDIKVAFLMYAKPAKILASVLVVKVKE
jgi:hypothetical protein